MKFRQCCFLLWTVALLAVVSLARADVPQLLNYQGVLTSGGNPVTTPVNVVFSIWNAETDGDSLWSELQVGVTPDADGVFNVLLGSVSPLPDSVFAGTIAYLSIKIGDDPEIDPRSRIVSSGYAHRVGTVDGASGGTITDALIITDGGGDTTSINPQRIVVRGAGGDVSTDVSGYSVIISSAGSPNVEINSDGIFIYGASKAGDTTIKIGSDGIVQVSGGIMFYDSTIQYTQAGASNGLPEPGGTMTGPINSTGDPRIKMGAGNFGSGNTNTGDSAFVAGVNNTASGNYSTISGGVNNIAGDTSSTVGGGSHNHAGGKYSVIAGGGGPDYADSNSASGDWSSIGGGTRNTASGVYSTVSGGFENTADFFYSTVGGGKYDTASGNYSTVGGGSGNVASDTGATVGGGVNNRASGNTSTISGGIINTASGDYATVCGGRYDSANGHYATVGGGDQNTASGDYAAVGGGGNNSADSAYATVGGGKNNTASGHRAFVGGGYSNTAGHTYSTVGGGVFNAAIGSRSTIGGGAADSTFGRYTGISAGLLNRAGDEETDSAAFVGGGSFNEALARYASILGGKSNTASGAYSAVPGGSSNVAGGDNSFAAGRRAQANGNGMFVWADNSAFDFPSATEGNFTVDTNMLMARSTGGVVFVSAVDGSGNSTSGVQLAAGGGSWSTLGGQNLRENIEPVDGSQVLAKIASLPISTWNYIAQDASIRHIGPAAEDLYAAFGMGKDERQISTIDADGIALAAIKALYEKTLEIDQLKEDIAELQSMVKKLAADK